MTEIQLVLAWVHVRFDDLREKHGHEAGFTTLEWVFIAGVVLIIAGTVGAILATTAKNGANKVNVVPSISP